MSTLVWKIWLSGFAFLGVYFSWYSGYQSGYKDGQSDGALSSMNEIYDLASAYQYTRLQTIEIPKRVDDLQVTSKDRNSVTR